MFNPLSSGCTLGYLLTKSNIPMINALMGIAMIMAGGNPTTPTIPKETAILIEEPATPPASRRERRLLSKKKRQNRRY